MKTDRDKSKQFSDPKSTFAAGLLYVFLTLTIVAFLLHLFGLDWFISNVELEEPTPIIQEIIKAILKAFELTFVYKILIRKRFIICIAISVIQSFVLGFLPVGLIQSIADAVVMFSIPIIFRKDRLWAIVDTLFLYLLMCLYGALSLIGKFGEYESTQIYSFYKNILSMVDYKLFILTLYLFVKYKGGIKLWKTKRRLLQP